MSSVASVGVAVAFLAGVTSFLSPCVLPLVPGYVSYVSGHTPGTAPNSLRVRLAAVGLSAFFVAGFSTVFVAFGAGASALGQSFLRYRDELNVVGGLVVIVFGLLMLGKLRRAHWLHRDFRFHPSFVTGHPASAYALGLAFGFGWTPCIGPVLGTILMTTAASGSGVRLLASYAMGLGVPFLLMALFVDRLRGAMGGMRRLGRALNLLGGLVLVTMGVAILTGGLGAFSTWLLTVLPWLGTTG